MYNLDEINKMITKIEKLTITVTNKKFHLSKLLEVKKLYDGCYTINRFLFDADYEYNYTNYKKAINIYYKQTTKKDMDRQLRLCKKFLLRQLYTIKREFFHI